MILLWILAGVAGLAALGFVALLVWVAGLMRAVDSLPDEHACDWRAT